MEFSEIFSFITIFNESFKLYPKIWKSVLLITLTSLIFPSLFFCVFSYQFTSFANIASQSQSDSPLKYLIILLLVEIVFMAIFVVFSHLSSISTVIVSATAYATGHTLALSDLLAHVRRTWKRPFRTSVRVSRATSISIILITVSVVVIVIDDLINPITIGLMIMLFILLLVFELRSSASKVLAYMVSIIEEENSEASKAVERSEYLVEGQRLKGFMFSLFVNIIACACMLIFWLIFRDQGSMNFTVYGLFFINFMTLFKVPLLVAYTVFYFQCKKLRGEEIDQVGGVFLYTKLPATA